ncbi:MAG: gluconokinase [Bacteroidota bacterium]
MADYIIGVDIGTGSTKAVAVHSSGKVMFTTQSSYPTLRPKPTYCEQVPELIWQAFVKCISRTVKELKYNPTAIVLSSAMHSLVLTDANAMPLMNMITWADNRSAEIAQALRQSSSGEMLYEQTGTPIHAMSPLCKILWLKKHEPLLFAQTHKFISIKEFIWLKLFDTFEIDYSVASATGLFDIESLQWNSNALSLCGISPHKLSKPVNTNHRRSNLSPAAASLLTITENTPFIIGASDGCMANLGSFAIEPGVAALTIGTSSAIRIAHTSPTHSIEAMTFNYRFDENLFISGGPSNNGGAALKWYAENFRGILLNSDADYRELLNDLKTTSPGADGLIFLPYLQGERAPIWNSQARGVFFGITSLHQQKHFTRAVVEGICFALYHIAFYLERTGLAMERIHVSGGFVHAPEWIQVLTDIFGKKVCLILEADASAIGAAYLGFKTLGIIEDYSQLMPEMITTLLPNTERHQIYQKHFLLYRQLYQSLYAHMSSHHAAYS